MAEKMKVKSNIQFVNHFLKNERRIVLLLFCVSLLVISPMILIGVFSDDGDILFHVQAANTFAHSISAGDFYPSWSAQENLGYGGTGLRFYPPGVSFLIGLAKIITNDWHIAVCLVFLFFTFCGCLGAYLWAKEYLPAKQAVLSGIIFILMPYHLFEIYYSSMWSEFAGVSVLPFVFLYITRICRKGKISDVVGLAVSYAVLILLHLPLTVIGSISFLFYALLIIQREKTFSTLIKLFFAVFFGIGASSIYLARMIFERDWFRIAKLWKNDHFDYNANFLFTSSWSFERATWFFNIMFIMLILYFIVWTITFYQNERKENVGLRRAVILLTFGSMLMTTELSKPILLILPFLQEVQFPWRWLAVASVSGSILGAIGIASLEGLDISSKQHLKSVKIYSAIVVFISTLIYGLLIMGFQTRVVPSGEYDNWAIDISQQMGMEWFWTVSTKEEAFQIKEKVIAGERESDILLWNNEERIFKIQAGEKTDVRVATLYYPHWKATVNDSPTKIKMSDEGIILIPLTENAATVRVWFEEPLRVKITSYISLICWLILLVAIVVNNLKTRINSPENY